MTDTPVPVFDGHNDVLLALRSQKRGFFEYGTEGHVDLPRARAGGLVGGLCAVFVRSRGRANSNREGPTTTSYSVPFPSTPSMSTSQRVALKMMAQLFALERQSDGHVRIIRTAADLENCLQTGVFAAVLHLEGAESIDREFAALHVFHRAGVRSLGPVWSRANRFGHGVPFSFPQSPDTGPGLTKLGCELIRTCNDLRVLIDLSHLNERGFWDVAALSHAPLVATHSNAHALCQSTRNLTDRQLDAIRDSDGMVGVNFHVRFLRPDGRGDPDTPLEVIADHIDYLVDRLGIDRVGFGSDFDGAVMPNALADASRLPAMVQTLRERGYDGDALHKLAHQNWVRVLRTTWGA